MIAIENGEEQNEYQMHKEDYSDRDNSMNTVEAQLASADLTAARHPGLASWDSGIASKGTRKFDEYQIARQNQVSANQTAATHPGNKGRDPRDAVCGREHANPKMRKGRSRSARGKDR